MRIIIITFILFTLQTNKVYAHQPFEIIKDSAEETIIDVSDASVSHAFYGEFESDNEEIIFNLNNLLFINFWFLKPVEVLDFILSDCPAAYI